MMSNTPERITLKKIWTELLEQLNLERGLGYTIKTFLLRPKRGMDEYLYQNRRKYTKPFSFLLLTTAITTFLMVEFVMDQQTVKAITDDPSWERIPDLFKPGLKVLIVFFRQYFNLAYISSLPLVTLAAYWVFRKTHPFNFAEQLVINTYIFSIQSLLYLLNIALLAIDAGDAWATAPALLLIIYFVYAYQQIFELSIGRAVLKCLLVYVIAQALNLVLLGIVVLVGMAWA